MSKQFLLRTVSASGYLVHQQNNLQGIFKVPGDGFDSIKT